MPQFDQIWSFPSQVFWLVICFAVLFFVVQRVVVPRVNEVRGGRRQRVDADLEKAAALKAEAESALAEYEKTIADARTEAVTAIRTASEEVTEAATRRRSDLAARLGREVEAAEQRIKGEKERALGEMEAIASDIAQAAAQRLLSGSVDERTARDAVAATLKEVR